MTDALTGGVKDCIEDCWCGWRNTHFSDARGTPVAGYDMHFDLRHLVNSQQGVVIEVALHNPSSLYLYGSLKRGRQSQTIPPSIWAMTMSGLTTIPRSMVQITRIYIPIKAVLGFIHTQAARNENSRKSIAISRDHYPLDM
jgi:hypothetical protein